MKRWFMQFVAIIPAALMLLCLAAWWQGEHGGGRYLLWTGRFSAWGGTDPGRFRVLVHYDSRADALPVRALYFRQWHPNQYRGGCFFGVLGPGSLVRYEDIADLRPDPGWSISVASFQATTGSIAMASLDEHLLVEAPYWMPVSLLGLLLVCQGWLSMRKLRHFFRRPGACAHCGYDLRVTRNRCPECGTLPVAGETVPRERLQAALAKVDLHFRRHAVGYSVSVFLVTYIFLHALSNR